MQTYSVAKKCRYKQDVIFASFAYQKLTSMLICNVSNDMAEGTTVDETEISTPWFRVPSTSMPRLNIGQMCKDIYASMLTPAVVVTAYNWKQPECPYIWS